ncbi:hypothetical protein FK531_03390 [Rhodococcus spelaei]|uniref:Uncharacterized protein n=1 Tax=Rhodococcus spelaei TaxID=2546320 RepID=A0A541BRY9_9NOCA|nr:hypothetical protein [Rhodococcus spelaei]TQF75104.1 hypothetical protein FK531_03390 [Rhodococcus spelaei]
MTKAAERVGAPSMTSSTDPRERTSDAALDIVAALDAMRDSRARDLRVRYALALEMVHDKQIQQALSTSIFSRPIRAV